MEFNNKYYLELFPKIKMYINETERYVNENNIELAFLNLRRAVEHIDIEYLKNDSWFIKIHNKNKQMPSLDCMNIRLYELKIFDEEQLMLFQQIRKVSNEYVHGTRDNNLYRKDKKLLNSFCTKLNTYLPVLPNLYGVTYTKSQIKMIRRKENCKYIRLLRLIQFYILRGQHLDTLYL